MGMPKEDIQGHQVWDLSFIAKYIVIGWQDNTKETGFKLSLHTIPVVAEIWSAGEDLVKEWTGFLFPSYNFLRLDFIVLYCSEDTKTCFIFLHTSCLNMSAQMVTMPAGYYSFELPFPIIRHSKIFWELHFSITYTEESLSIGKASQCYPR